MEAYIYTYVNKETKKTYIGSRHSYIGNAENDFNIKYFSSSENPEFNFDMANNKLEGQIILKINCDNAKKRVVKLEHQIIWAYWNKFGEKKSYNLYCNGYYNINGKRVHIRRKYIKAKPLF